MMTPMRLGRELAARLDGPHADEHTTATANLAAEAIRYLNYATGSHSPAGVIYPATVYSIAADLALASQRMTQLFAQLGDWLETEDLLGHLGTDDGRPSAETVTAALGHLGKARNSANYLCSHLESLQNGIAGLNGRGPNSPERAE